MSFITVLLIFSLFTLTFSIYSKWQFSDDRGETSGRWHTAGAVMRILAVLSAFVFSIFPTEWQNILLAGVIQMPLWDLGINIIALKVKALYLGTTARTDQLKAKKWVFYGVGLIFAVVVKIFSNFSNQDLLTWIKNI